MRVYHATFRQNLPSIYENGLGGEGKKLNLERSIPLYTYFAEEQKEAESIARFISAKESNSFTKEDIVVLSIDIEQLNLNYLIRDLTDYGQYFYKYSGIVDGGLLREEIRSDNRGKPISFY